jgi:hypothetical protein
MEKYGRLKPLYETRRDKNGKQLWMCECECGKVVEKRLSDLKSGNTSSCGCLDTESRQERHRKKTGVDFIVSETSEYKSYCMAKNRCENKNDPAYSRYGGRGIKMNMTFAEMIKAIGRKPHSQMSIDRIDNNGNYEVGNIRWADNFTQARNKRRTSTAGVHFREDTKKWRAYIGVDGKLIHLGSYLTKEEAQLARNEALNKYW